MKKIIIAMILLLAAALLMTCAAGEVGKPTGTRLPIIEQESVTRDCFFANGTQIFIESPKADVTGWIHDTEVQEGLGNGFSPSKKPGLRRFTVSAAIRIIRFTGTSRSISRFR